MAHSRRDARSAIQLARILPKVWHLGELPRAFARVHPTFRTPHIAIITCSVISLAIGLAGTFAATSTLSAIGRLIVYGMTCASLIMLRRRGEPPAAFMLPGGPVFAVVGILFTIWLLSTRSFTQAWIIGAILLAGAVIRLSMRKRQDSVAV